MCILNLFLLVIIICSDGRFFNFLKYLLQEVNLKDWSFRVS